MESMMMEILPKLGLLIGAFFSISPIPTIVTAITKDKNALKSISIPGSIMGLSCSTSILAFCEIQGDSDCVLSCWMFLASAGLCLATYTALHAQLPTLALIAFSQFALYRSVHHYLSPEVTSLVCSSLNLLACVLMPLDQLDKLLRTRDISYCSYLMNVLNAISCMIWGVYHWVNGNIMLSISNFAGVWASLILIPGAMYANKVMDLNNPAVVLSEISVNITYRWP
jgi:uncharacterized protein with PQ loop repeat